MGTAPPTGVAPATSGLTGRCYHWLSYGGLVRALGLEPSLWDRRGDRSLDDASAVVKVLVSRLVAGRVEAGSEGVEPPAGGVGDRGATVARAQVDWDAHDVVRVVQGESLAGSARSAAPYQRTTGLPVLAASRRVGFAS